MWYPPWFDSYESWILSATCVCAFGCLLRLMGVHDTLRKIEKQLHERSERDREEGGGEA